MTGHGNKRRKILIDSPFQIRLAFIGSIIGAIEVLIAGVSVMMVALFSIWIPAGDHLVVFYKFVAVIALTIVVVTGVNVLIAIYLSHRIAGPIYRLKQSMQQVGEGDLSLLIRFREGDELQTLKDEFNSMVSNIRERVLAMAQGNKRVQGIGRKRGTAGAKKDKTSIRAVPFKLD